MPRPKFQPNPEQRHKLTRLAQAAKAERRAADTTDRLIAEVHQLNVPVSIIAETTGRQRKTIYRHLRDAETK